MKRISVAITIVLIASAGLLSADLADNKMAQDKQGNAEGYTSDVLDRDGGDDCAGAPTITVAMYVDSGNTSGYVDDWGPSVSSYGQDGEDQAYKIVLSSPDTITVTVTPNDAGFDLSTYMFAEADCPNYIPVVLAGIDSGFAGDAESFSYSAAAGTYYIIVDSYLPGEVGPFTIEVESSVPVELMSFSVQ